MTVKKNNPRCQIEHTVSTGGEILPCRKPRWERESVSYITYAQRLEETLHISVCTGSKGQNRKSEMSVPEGEKRRTLTAELWAVLLGTRAYLKVAVGSLSSEPSDAITQICNPEPVTERRRRNGRGQISDQQEQGNGGGGEERRWGQPTLTSWSAPAVARRREAGWKSRLSTGCWSCQLICSVPPRIL